MTGILPIHPIAALLLKNISTYFASNQRSMFNFIKNNDPNIDAFQNFIATKSPGNGDLLTFDYLWNFFYESGTDEHGGGVGRMNLSPSIRQVLDSYELNKDNLNLDEQAVLKTVLLFQAVNMAGHGDVEIFLPSEKNLELSFAGTENLDDGKALLVAQNLVRKDILYKKPGDIETFAVMSLSGDLGAVEKLKREISDNVRTENLVADAGLIEHIETGLTPAQKFRCELIPVTVNNFTSTIKRITNERETFKLKIVVSFARNESERDKILELTGKAISDPRYNKLVLLDASSNLMNGENFKCWVEYSANEKYWRGKDNSLAEKMKRNAGDCLKEWQSTFENGSFVYCPAVKNDDEERKRISRQSLLQINEELRNNVNRLYKYSFDHVNVAGTLFATTNLTKLSEAGIREETFSMLRQDSVKTVLGDVWKISGKYWEVYPDLNISRLKTELDNFIKEKIEKNVRVSFDDIFNFLIERGFMPANIYAFLTGFLLKEYVKDPYRYSAGIDGSVGGAMTEKKMSECIGEAMKNVVTPIRNYRPKYIEIMSKNQQRFMDFSKFVFGVSEDVSVEQSAQKLRIKLKDLTYPFWCYVDASEPEYKEFLKLISQIANSRESVGGISALAESAGRFLNSEPAAVHDLKLFLTPQKGREIFTEFLKKFEGGIIFETAEKIGVADVVSECQRRVSGGDAIWLSDKETAEEDLKKFIVDYKIVAESQKFGIEEKSLNACVSKWRDCCKFNIKIPADTMGNYYAPLKDFFDVLKNIAERGEIPQVKRNFFLSQLVENASTIRAAIFEPLKVLREKYAYHLEGLSEEEISDIYQRLPIDSFKYSQGNFIKTLTGLAQKTRERQFKSQLLKLWREVARNKLPHEWSKVNRTPISAMVPENEETAAQKIFRTVESNSPTENEVKFATDYLSKRPAYFADLNNPDKIEDAFRKKIVGEYCEFLSDNNEIRNLLETKFSGEIYDWYPNVRVNKIINEFAKNKYYNGGGYDKVTERVMRMSDEEAKNLLIDLLDKNYEVGLKLLKVSQ